MYWEIEPHDSSDYDFAILPGRNEEDHQAALQYAQERLELGFDGLEEGDKFTVTIRLRKGEMPEEIEVDE